MDNYDESHHANGINAENIHTDTPRNSLSLFRVSKVKELEKFNVELLDRVKQLEKFCSQLKEDNFRLQIENEKLKSNFKNGDKNENEENNENNDENSVHRQINNEQSTSQTHHVYETDEEELARETEWIVNKNKKANKKRNPKPSPEMVTQSHPVQMIQNNVENQTAKKVLQPPPVMVTVNIKFNDLNSLIKKTVKNDFTVKVMNNNTYKINTFASDDYREITKIFNENKMLWHTYEDKQNRPIRVLVKNLHHTCEPNDIIDDLKNQGFNILSASIKLKYKTKDPLDMFVLTFDNSENVNKLYEIKQILNTLVTIEPIRPSKYIPQCKNCQSYNHTKNYCSKPPRCVKCTGKHETKNCDKPAIVYPKCCNCGEKHPANYRGCVVAKELQKLRNKTRNKSQMRYNDNNHKPTNSNPQKNRFSQSNQNTQPSQNFQINNNSLNPNMQSKQIQPNTKQSYSDTVKSNESNKTKHVDDQKILEKILLKLEHLETFNKNIEDRLIALEQNINY